MYAHKGKSNGTFNVTVAGEPRNFTSASVSIACGPIGCGQQVVFETELEDLVKHVIGVSFVYQSAPGTYEVIPGQYSAPGGRYGVQTVDSATGGSWATVYHAGTGTVTLISADEATQSMKGSFSFQVRIDDIIQTIAGTFDLHE